MAEPTLTPMLRQYHELKQQHPGTLLFFRLGDFYELFFDDAVTGARELEITLTARHKERGAAAPPRCAARFGRGRGGGGRAREGTPPARDRERGAAGIPMCGVPHHSVSGYIAKL